MTAKSDHRIHIEANADDLQHWLCTTESVSVPELKDFFHIQPVLWIRIRTGSGFKGVPGSVTGFAIRIMIQEGKNEHKKYL
jgi:hypothetical protein